MLVYLESFIVRGNLSLRNLGLMLLVDYLITWGLNVRTECYEAATFYDLIGIASKEYIHLQDMWKKYR